MALKTTPVQEETAKKPRTPRKPKVQVQTEVEEIPTPVNKPRAPRKQKFQTPPLTPTKEEIILSIDKVISGIKTEPKKPKEPHLIIEIAIGILLALGAYGLGSYINAERVPQVETNATEQPEYSTK